MIPLARRLLAEFLGTALLLVAVVGASATATALSGDPGLRLLQNSSTVALALAAIIYMFAPVSRSHFNPVVSIADWLQGNLTARELAGYVCAQLAGALTGTILGNLMSGLPTATVSTTTRTGPHLLLSEAVATAGLLVLIAALTRTGRGSAGPGAVGAYIGAACWFTSSACFANPAVTLARTLTGTEAGIAPPSVPLFILAQLAGLAAASAVIPTLYPRPTIPAPSPSPAPAPAPAPSPATATATATAEPHPVPTSGAIQTRTHHTNQPCGELRHVRPAGAQRGVTDSSPATLLEESCNAVSAQVRVTPGQRRPPE